jgi:hypothetical protein
MRQRLYSLEKICIEVKLLFDTDFIFFEPHEDKMLRQDAARALPRLTSVYEMLRDLARNIKP